MHICSDEIFALMMIIPGVPFLYRQVMGWYQRAVRTWRNRHVPRIRVDECYCHCHDDDPRRTRPRDSDVAQA